MTIIKQPVPPPFEPRIARWTFPDARRGDLVRLMTETRPEIYAVRSVTNESIVLRRATWRQRAIGWVKETFYGAQRRIRP